MKGMFYCDACNSEMKLLKTFGKIKAKVSINAYRARRFGCTVCDFTKMVFADGLLDGNDGYANLIKIEE